jgi:uncharacterized protein YggE
MDQAPDVIVITARHEEDVSAERAELLVVVQGSSLVTGRAALKKAKEVAKLVEELEKCGVSQDEVGLEDIRAEVSSGILGKSSSATYRLRIRCAKLELLPEVLGAITSAKNARLEDVVWRYPDSAAQQAKWLQACIAWANVKAGAAAAALGTRLVGVHRLTEQRLDEPDYTVAPATAYPGAGMRSRTGELETLSAGLDLGHQKRDGLKISVEYRVEGLRLPAA